MGVNLVFQRIALYVSTANPKIQSTFSKMKEFFEQVGPSHIGLSFNGGKDSTATLFLALYTLQRCSHQR
jgi:predicted phosphoadenosine phosphosulfate sulfurtransferase